MKLYRLYPILLLLLVTLTAAAEDMPVRQGCRRGTPRPQGMMLRRGAPDGQPKLVGGDFYHGERHQLTVLVAFNDRSFKGDEAASLEQWNEIFNTRNLSEAPFKGSVHDYFYAQSYDDFDLTFDLVYVKVKGNAAKYASTNADDENSQYLIPDVIEELLKRDIDWSLYDWNGDGFVNQLLIVYAGQGMNSYNPQQYSGNLIWPHQWWMSEHLKDRQPGVYCEPIPVSYGGKEYKVDCYCALAELTRNNDYGSFGVICHEYTHCFGFPDFYFSGKSYVGAWELMDSGNYNDGGYCPPGYSAHERWLMGWLTPVELTTATTISDMPALCDAPQAYLIRNEGYEDEYYIVENRQQKGWDAGVPGKGIIVFHIDYNPDNWVSVKEPPNHPAYTDKGISYPARQRYLIFPANNSSSTSSYYCSNWPYPYNGNNELTNTSTPAAALWNPNTDNTKLMSKPITNMTVTDNLASFDFMGGTSSIPSITSASGVTSSVVYDLQGRCISSNSLTSSQLPKGIYIINGKKVVVK